MATTLAKEDGIKELAIKSSSIFMCFLVRWTFSLTHKDETRWTTFLAC